MTKSFKLRDKVHTQASRTGEQPNLCKLCDIGDFEGEEFSLLASDIMALRTEREHAIQHRKLWEFTQTIRALKMFDLLNSESRVLSVAAGTERILYYLARHVEQVVASDIYGIGDFANREAATEATKNPEKFAPYDYPQHKLSLGYMNALDLSFKEGIFDAAFCLSSIEHFGGFKAAQRALQQMANAVRPGGLVIVTTDCALNGLTTNEVFTTKQIESLANTSDLELVSPIDWSISDDSRAHLIDMRKDPLTSLPHVNLKLFGSVFTSVSLVYRKPGNRSDTKLPLADFNQEIARAFAAAKQIQLPTPTVGTVLRAKLRGLRLRMEEALFY
jgi:SAM-dependent methyltransferase